MIDIFIAAVMAPMIGLNIVVSDFKEAQKQSAMIDTANDCNYACSQVALLKGIDSAKALCGDFVINNNPFSNLHGYQKCVRPKDVKEVTSEANKIRDDSIAELEAKSSNQEQQLSNSEVHVVKNNGFNLTTITGSISGVTGRPFDSRQFKNLGIKFTEVLKELKYVVWMGSSTWLRNTFGPARFGNDNWQSQRDCDWLAGVDYDPDCLYFSSRCIVRPFCEANKDFPDCKQFLDIYGKCEKILADAANKNEL